MYGLIGELPDHPLGKVICDVADQALTGLGYADDVEIAVLDASGSVLTLGQEGPSRYTTAET